MIWAFLGGLVTGFVGLWLWFSFVRERKESKALERKREELQDFIKRAQEKVHQLNNQELLDEYLRLTSQSTGIKVQ